MALPTAKTIALPQLAWGYPTGCICRALTCYPHSFVHNLFLDKPDGLFAIVIQPDGQGLLDFDSAQPDNRFGALIHIRTLERLALALPIALLKVFWTLIYIFEYSTQLEGILVFRKKYPSRVNLYLAIPP